MSDHLLTLDTVSNLNPVSQTKKTLTLVCVTKNLLTVSLTEG